MAETKNDASLPIQPYSTHILFFPFQWRLAGEGNPPFDYRQLLARIPKLLEKSPHWKIVPHSRQRNAQDYSQFNYLHEAVHPAVFGHIFVRADLWALWEIFAKNLHI